MSFAGVGDGVVIDVVVFIVIVSEFVLRVLVLAIAGATESLHLHEPPDGDGADGSERGECPPRHNHVAGVDAERECDATDRRSRGATEGGDAGGDAVEGAEDAERDGGIGEEDGGAWEGENDAPALEKHDCKHDDLLSGGCREEDGEGCQEVDDGEGEGTDAEAVEDAETAGDGWEYQELDEHAADAVEGEEKADAFGI